MLETFKFCRVREVKMPTRGDDEAAGIDFYIPTNLTKEVLEEKRNMINARHIIKYNYLNYMNSIEIFAGESVLIPSGIHICLEKGYCLKFENKSGVASKKHVLIGSCIVDSNYEGEIHINIHNVGSIPIEINAGEKIVQGVIYKVELPKFNEYSTLAELYEDRNSTRGTGGFGSTGTC